MKQLNSLCMKSFWREMHISNSLKFDLHPSGLFLIIRKTERTFTFVWNGKKLFPWTFLSWSTDKRQALNVPFSTPYFRQLDFVEHIIFLNDV